VYLFFFLPTLFSLPPLDPNPVYQVLLFSYLLLFFFNASPHLFAFGGCVLFLEFGFAPPPLSRCHLRPYFTRHPAGECKIRVHMRPNWYKKFYLVVYSISCLSSTEFFRMVQLRCLIACLPRRLSFFCDRRVQNNYRGGVAKHEPLGLRSWNYNTYPHSFTTRPSRRLRSFILDFPAHQKEGIYP
jgi:hypothetical protein